MDRKTIDNLDIDSVSIVTQKFTVIDGKEVCLSEKHRRSYVNSLSGRCELQENETKDIVDAVLAIWGDKPHVVNYNIKQ